MERYGEKPKKFTKAWFEYIWEYYKLHMIITVLVVAAIGYTWWEFASRPYWDLSVTIAGREMVSEGAKEILKQRLKDHVQDVNGDGEIMIKIADYTISDDYDDFEYASALESKFYLELISGESYLYIMQEDRANKLLADPSVEGVFSMAEEFSQKDRDNRNFVSAENSTFLKGVGILYDDLYVGVKNITPKQADDKEETLKMQNAMAAARIILGE